MFGRTKRWQNDAGEVFEVVNPDDFNTRWIVMRPIDGEDLETRRVQVARHDIEDQRGWKPAPDHRKWRPIDPQLLLGDDDRCRFGCGECGARCTRGTGSPDHTRHYHSVVRRGCP